jgi:inorganic phosphate transporter, PiT family
MLELQIVVYGIVTAALFFDFVKRFHDSANSIATVVGTRVLKHIQAVVMAAVTSTVGKGIIQPEFSTVYVIFAGLIGAAKLL